jgi:transcriptional pleiotropic regulator of transition state genes
MKVITTRKIDELGRIVLPAELRTSLDVQAGDELDIYTDADGNIVLHKAVARCAFCKEMSNLIHVSDKYICSSCKELISKAK